MVRKLIKNLGKSKSVKRVKFLFKKIFIIVFIVVSIVVIFNIMKYFEELYKVRDLKSIKIEYYMDVVDEVGDGKV